ncbi:hypothetical protein DFP73DRAFT_595682 [Morchella snyderi]|nr:hypothetical protein DFP73DRAFT_595682 [Morchella snyderi]
MPSPNQDMLNFLDKLRCADLDADIIRDANSPTLESQATEILHHEDTSHQQRLLFTILNGMVNQNAILTAQIEALQAVQEELTLEGEKTAARLAVISNKVDRVNEWVGNSPRGTQPLPPPTANHPPKKPRILQHPAHASPAPPQTAASKPARTTTQAPSYAQAAQDNPRQWEQVTHKKTTPKKRSPAQDKKP